MGYASKQGRAIASSRHPTAAGQCDRCGFVYQHSSLSWNMDYAGTSIQNKRLLVCSSCLDVPQQQLRTITLPADPMPIQNPRVPNFLYMETNYRTTSEGDQPTFSWTGIPIPDTTDIRETENGNLRVTQQTGFANGSLNDYPGTDANAPGNDDPGLPLDNVDVPRAGLYPDAQNYAPYPAPDGFHWEFVYDQGVPVYDNGEPVVNLVEDA